MNTQPFRFRIAIATNDGTHINGHFGSCEAFAIYEFDVDTIEYIESRTAATVEGVEKNSVRADQLTDCHLLYVASIGGPAAAKVIRHGLHPLKDAQEGPIADTLAKLQQVLQGTPPPWMAKLMGRENPLASTLATGSSE